MNNFMVQFKTKGTSLLKDENFDVLYDKIKAVKDNDIKACDWMVEKYQRLLIGVVQILKRTFRFVEYQELYEIVKAFFIQLIVEYDYEINNNFTNYAKRMLYFRVKEFMSFDYEQTDILHSDREETVMQYCCESMYQKSGTVDLSSFCLLDVMDYLQKHLDAEELDMFVCYYILRFTQEQIATITGMTQCPINLKISNINTVIKDYFKEIKENV